MPLYEYQCDACGRRFEVIQKFSETTEQCRLCGKGPVNRLMSSPAIQFKGTGWYVTDYAQKGKSDTESKGTADTTSKETKSDAAKSDTSSKSDTPTTPPSPSSATTKD